MRFAGVALMIGGMVAQPALRRILHWRARVGEQRAAFVLRLDQPDVVTELIGSALVLTAQRREERRRGGFTPLQRRGTHPG